MENRHVCAPAAGEHTHTLVLNRWAFGSCSFVCSCVGAKLGISDNRNAGERQEVLRRRYFYECRKGRERFCSPDFRHKESEEPLWLNHLDKINRVEARLAVLEKGSGCPVQPPINPLMHHTEREPTEPEWPGHGISQAVTELCDTGHLRQAVDVLTVLAETQSSVSTSLLYTVIRRCGTEKNLVLGRRIDDLTVKLGHRSNAFLGNHILRMYACQGQLQEARKVFSRVAKPDGFMWFSIISAETKYGEPGQAIQLYHDMRKSGLEPNSHVFVAALQACAKAEDLQSGRQVHADLLASGLQPNSFVSNCLVDMYAKCGQLDDARMVFDSLPRRDVVAWSAMINGYAEHGHGLQALTLYARMEQEGLIAANSVTFGCLLKACAKTCALQQGRQLHSQIVEKGLLEGNTVLGSCLINMYVSCGKLEDARMVFDSLATRDAGTWNAMINGYAEQGLDQQALTLYVRMEQEGLIFADSVTFACLLKACGSAGAPEQGRQLHAKIVERGLLKDDTVVGNCLVDMYAKCGELEDAHRVFDSLATRDVVAWTALMNGYVEHGFGSEALTLYARMGHEGLVEANGVTFACLLKACASAGALQQGRQLHSKIVERGLLDLDGDVLVGSSLVNMYAKCGQLDVAQMVFDSLTTRNVVAWSAMINGYAEHGLGLEALTLYARMEQEGETLANSVTFACLLKACASAGALPEGRQLHSRIVERGLLEGDVVLGNCLVAMYAKCGEVDEARRVFDSLVTRDVVAWTAMINGYVQHGLGPQALALYARMEQEGLILADSVTFACLFKACAEAGALQQGKWLHSQLLDRGLLDGDKLVGSCLIEMYAKCGKMDDARLVFDSLSTKDVVTWTAMISGYGTNNEGQKAIACFEEMMLAGLQPDHTTYTCLLVACSHEGLVSQGRHYLNAMVQDHGLSPTTEHHICMVDLLGRAGYLNEAENMMLSVGCESNYVGLMSLLNSCKYHGDVERGTRCFERLVKLDPRNASAYVLMANAYADADRWADVDRVDRLRKLAGASKKPAVAGIEVKKQVHTFVVGDKRDTISCKLRNTIARLKEEGNHVPHTKAVLKPLSEKEKEDDLCGHAEKLALAYGLLNTPEGTPLLVTKNLRMCRDCHSSTAILSRVEKRKIVVRDGHRVHRFEAGFCSCKGQC